MQLLQLPCGIIRGHAVSRILHDMLCLLFAASAFAADEDGTPAPRFHAKTTSGETFNNDSIKGKVVLLEFWTSWCVYRHQEEALVEEINKEFTGKGLVVLANPNSIVWE